LMPPACGDCGREASQVSSAAAVVGIQTRRRGRTGDLSIRRAADIAFRKENRVQSPSMTEVKLLLPCTRSASVAAMGVPKT
jgi:hypothetical protein